MIEPRFVLPVETVLVDRGSNAVSLINVLEEIHPAGYPLLIPKFTIYAVTTRTADDPATARGRASIFLDDEEIFADEQELNFGEAMLNRSLLQFQGFLLPRAGVLSLRFSVEDVEVRSYPLPAFPAGDAPHIVQLPSEGDGAPAEEAPEPPPRL